MSNRRYTDKMKAAERQAIEEGYKDLRSCIMEKVNEERYNLVEVADFFNASKGTMPYWLSKLDLESVYVVRDRQSLLKRKALPERIIGAIKG